MTPAHATSEPARDASSSPRKEYIMPFSYVLSTILDQGSFAVFTDQSDNTVLTF